MDGLTNDITPLDGAVLAIVIVALVRGCWRGLIAEAFSIAALGGMFIAVRYFNAAGASWLIQVTNGEVGEVAAPWISGAVIAALSATVIGIVGRWVRRGVKAVGLGFADRLAGGVLGVAEGTLVAGIVVLGCTWIASEHPAVARSRSLVALEQAQAYVGGLGDSLPDVAAPRED